MRFDPSAVEAILFDLDGTLIDTDDEAVATLARRLAPLARLVPFAPDRLARRLVMWAETPGNALVTLFDRAGVDDNIFAIGDTLRRWRGLRPRHRTPSQYRRGQSHHPAGHADQDLHLHDSPTQVAARSNQYEPLA